MPNQDRKKTSFLKRQDWFLSAGLVFVIYLVLLITVKVYVSETNYLDKVIHALPLLAAGLLVLGFFEKRKKEEALRERKMKRYQARLELSRLQRESGDRSKGEAGPGREKAEEADPGKE